MLNVYEQIDANKRRSFLVILVFIVFITLVAWILGQALDYGPGFIATALIFSGLMSFSSYYWSDKIILGLSQAHPANREEYFDFYTVCENLSLAGQIPKPKLYVIDDSASNAFATGRDPQHAVICTTTGLLEKLNRSELEGVIGHEISHIKNFDIRLMSLVTVLVGMVTLLADWFLMGASGRRRDKEGSGIILLLAFFLALLSPLIANLIKLAISRRREFLADASSAMITRFPQGLIRALEKISQDQEPLEVANKATAHLYIVNPFKNLGGVAGKVASLFNTHPPIEERLKALRAMQ